MPVPRVSVKILGINMNREGLDAYVSNVTVNRELVGYDAKHNPLALPLTVLECVGRTLGDAPKIFFSDQQHDAPPLTPPIAKSSQHER